MVKTIAAAVEIQGTPAEVWAVLADGAHFADWNPFIRKWDGELKVGNRVTIQLQPAGGRPYTFRPTLLVVEPEREIRWLGKLGFGGLFNGEHSLRVERVAGSGTRFVQSERFTGILLPLLRGTVAGALQGFEAMNQALKLRVEARGSATPASG
jgi:hypothetical protein